jgi:hypothetical protein
VIACQKGKADNKQVEMIRNTKKIKQNAGETESEWGQERDDFGCHTQAKLLWGGQRAK